MASIIVEQRDNSYIQIPVSVIDKYLTKASHADLKVYLWLVSNQGKTVTDDGLAQMLGITTDELKKSITFWISEGVFSKRGERINIVTQGFLGDNRVTYTGDVINEKIKNNRELAVLIESCEKMLDKPLSPRETGVLLGLCDWLGMPVGVVLTVIEYCVENGKKSLGYIEKTAISWFESGITTDGEAIKHIALLREKKTMQSKYASLIGASGRNLTESEKKYVATWTEEYGFDLDMIGKAYEKSIDLTGKYSGNYMNSVLRAWFNKGYRTVEDTEDEQKPVSKISKEKPSYDLQKSFENSWEIIHKGDK